MARREADYAELKAKARAGICAANSPLDFQHELPKLSSTQLLFEPSLCRFEESK